MATLYQYGKRWVTADQLRELRDGSLQLEPKIKLREVGQELTLKELRVKYKELHPENKGVSPRYINDAEYLKNKIAEFNK